MVFASLLIRSRLPLFDRHADTSTYLIPTNSWQTQRPEVLRLTATPQEAESRLQEREAQIEAFNNHANSNLIPTRDLMNDFLRVLIDMECNGNYIDLQELDLVEKELNQEYYQLKNKINKIQIVFSFDPAKSLLRISLTNIIINNRLKPMPMR